MSDEYDELFNESGSDGNLPKKLRAVIDELKGELKGLREENNQLKGAQRERTVSELIAEKGLNPKVAKFIPQDLEPTKEAIEQWLSEEGDVFAPVGQSNEQQAPKTPEAQVRMAEFEADADEQQINVVSDYEQLIKSAKSIDELKSIMARIGA